MPHFYPNTFIDNQFTNNNVDLINSITISSDDDSRTILDITIDYKLICESKPISNM